MKSDCVRRMTRQRKMILAAVNALGCHPTADQVYDVVRRDLPRISLSTVYRNLGILADEGCIGSVGGRSGETHYDHNTHRHFHAQCTACGKVVDIPMRSVSQAELNVGAIEGFTIEDIIVTATGVCSRCAQLETRSEEK